jgi:predicted nucleic acid-binding protein
MITALDTNVLLDIFFADPKFGADSANAVKECLQAGALVACPVVWAEVATAFPSRQQFLDAFEALTVSYSPILQEASLTASEVWRRYRQKGGKRERIAADFLIGAHARVQCQRLLTRDRGFYRLHFESLAVVSPTDFKK